jgi:hypothetical protein
MIHEFHVLSSVDPALPGGIFFVTYRNGSSV